ncbi:MAG: peptide-N-glycosidase F-related protein [Rikenellaceae bacterium]
MKKILLCTFLFAATLLPSCSSDNNQVDDNTQEEVVPEKKLFVYQLDREPWSEENPLTTTSKFTATHDELKLEFFGWSLEEDASINITFPEETDNYNKAILTYRMGGWNEGPAEWDMATQIMVLDKESGEYYEIARAITPYGASFDISWNKTFYLDVTEYLPMLTGDTEFRIFYGGFDATETNAHTVKMTFDLYSTENVEPRTLYHAKIYDSRQNHNGYRGWYYGSDSLPIEDDARLGLREFTLPEDVASLLMKVNITGHGMEQGVFPDRDAYITKNAAEFDENTYEVVINGTKYGTGHIFYDNGDTYFQSGTFKYDRANWGPGLPVNTHYWAIDNLPSDREMSIDLNLENYISPSNQPAAFYMVQVDIFGLSM